jgi:sodium--glutamate symport carrier gltS
MDALAQRNGMSKKAFLSVPLVAVFVVDTLNAVTIKLFLGYFPFASTDVIRSIILLCLY